MDPIDPDTSAHGPPTSPGSDAAEPALSTDDCMRLLSHSSLGRVVLTRHALPVVLPVRFRMDFSGTLVLSFVGGAPAASSIDGAVIALQAERLDPDTLAGSSVMVHGRAVAAAGDGTVQVVPEVVIGTVLSGRSHG